MSFGTFLISERKIFLLVLFFSCAHLFPQADSSAVYKITSVSIKGNRKTKERIILRELSRQINDTVSLLQVRAVKKRSEQNIFNTLLFVYDTIYPVINHADKTVHLDIHVKERWYIWPVPVFEVQDRNFNTWWEKKDLFRINYGVALGLENFTGVKDRFVVLLQRGYTEKYGFSYRRPYINKKQTVGVGGQYIFSRNNEVTYKTENNLPLFVRQYSKYLRQDHEARASLFYRPNLYEQNTVEVFVRSSKIEDTVSQLNPFYFGGERNSIFYAGLQYRYTFDNRDNKIYPLAGWAFDAWVNKDGFDYSEKSPVNLLYVTGSLRKHTRLYPRWYLANLVKGRLMNADQLSFNFNRALGWNDLIRGYEYYVLDGQRYFLTKNSLRYQLVKPRVYQTEGRFSIKQFNTIPYSLLLNVYFDAGYVEDKFYFKNNPLSNSWQYGYGVGLDFVTYYDIVLRLEYSMNKLNQSGFFIHMTSGF